MLFLGVDGGGTKTTLLLMDSKGNIVARATKGTIDYLRIGADKFKKELKEGIHHVCYIANVGIDDITYAFLGIPGFEDEIIDEIPTVENLVKSILPETVFECGNDAVAGWAGSLACQPGINLVAGTGTIGLGVDRHGNIARSSGWGYLIGDEGSAYWLGKKMIEIFSKQADGRLKKSLIYQLVRDKYNLTNEYKFLQILYKELEMKRDEIAQFALLLYEAAKQGDCYAIKAFEDAAFELALVVKSLIGQLDFHDEKVMVSYSGGVFKAGELILKPFCEALQNEKVKMINPILSPAAGAAYYAFNQYSKEGKESGVLCNLIHSEKNNPV